MTVRSQPTRSPIHYRVSCESATRHQLDVTLTIPQPESLQTLSLPVWIPGSYLVREFARHLGPVLAQQGRKKATVVVLDKATWQVRCNPAMPLTVRYSVYAHDASVRTAWLEASRGFFNPTSVCLQAHTPEEPTLILELVAPRPDSDWTVATGARPLTVNAAGWGTYQFDSYDELADSPFEMGPLWRDTFKVAGVPHQLAVAHPHPSFDGERLLADTQKICASQIAFWHGGKKPPHKRYAFLLATVDQGYGGLEHQHSTALICKREDLPRVNHNANTHEGYQDLLGLISHEYFHTWNVKRMRPRDLTRYDYTQENYTELLWFFEGFTSYYDDLILVRAGLITPEVYLKRLGKTLQQVLATPGRHVQPLAQASFDAWIRYYRPDENTANSTVSYYTKGALVALCLDLTLRYEGHGNLDDVMRHLWATSQGGPVDETAILQALQHVGKRSYQKEIKQWVHSTTELPVLALLARHGVGVHYEGSGMDATLGLKVRESQGIWITQVMLGSAAQEAGFSPGDEWLGVQVPAAPKGGRKHLHLEWRLQKLSDLPAIAGHATRLQALVARDKRLLWLNLDLPAPAKIPQLRLKDNAIAQRWLQSR